MDSLTKTFAWSGKSFGYLCITSSKFGGTMWGNPGSYTVRGQYEYLLSCEQRPLASNYS